MSRTDPEWLHLMIMGAHQTGKWSCAVRALQNMFPEDDSSKYMIGEPGRKQLRVDDKLCTVEFADFVWSELGQMHSVLTDDATTTRGTSTLLVNEIRKCQCFWLMFAVDDRESLDALERCWDCVIEVKNRQKRETGEQQQSVPAIMLVGNKIDLVSADNIITSDDAVATSVNDDNDSMARTSRRWVTRREATNFAKERGIPYVECSAKTGHNVEEMLHQVVRLYRASNNNSGQEQMDNNKKSAGKNCSLQ